VSFDLNDHRLDSGIRRGLLRAIRSQDNKLADNFAHALKVDAEKAGVLNGSTHGDILVAAEQAVQTGIELDKLSPQHDSAGTEALPVELDLKSLAKTQPEPPPFIVKDWLPQGEVTLFAGHGGSGKSLVALILAVCIAIGRPFFGLATERRKALFLSLEDSSRVLHWRLARICEWIGISMADLAGHLVVLDGTGTDAALMTETRDDAMLTPMYEWLRQRMQGSEVLILDGVSDSFDANENQRAAVRRFMRAIRQLIPPTGAALTLAHVDKASAKAGDTSQGYSGSTAWSNSARARWYLRKEEDDGLLLEVQKSNHAATGQSLRLNWNPEAHVFVGQLAMPATKLERDLAECDERETVLELVRKAYDSGNPVPAAQGGTRTAWHVLSAMDGFPPRLTGKGGSARLFQLIERLIARNQLTRESQKTGNRNSREVLKSA
jgi:RecA-family ATPase